MSFGKMFLAVFLAVLAAGGIFAFVRQVQADKAKEASAQRDVAEFTARLHESNLDHEAQMERTNQETRDLEPSSPCSRLDGDNWRKCKEFSSIREQRKFVAGILRDAKKPVMVSAPKN